MKTLKRVYTCSLLLTLISTAPFLSACSGRHHSSETTTEVVRDSGSSDTSRYDDRPTVEVTTKTEEVTHEDNHRGFFGIIGDILALPFRAIASIL